MRAGLLTRASVLAAVASLAWYCSSMAKVGEASSPPVPIEKALLWEVRGPGLKKPSYLFGTIHLISKEEFQLSSAVRSALERVESIAFEVSLQELAGAGLPQLARKMLMSGNTTLRDLLSEEDYAFVREQLLQRSMLPITIVERMKPMFTASLLEGGQEGVGKQEAMTSVDLELYRLARKARLSVRGLETIEAQVGIFDSIPYRVQARFLVEQLRQHGDEGGEAFEQVMRLYRQKDIQAMESFAIGSFGQDSLFQHLILYQRNRNWIPVMVRMMRDHPTFFAVGAGHLGGANGVIVLLRQQGFRVIAID